MALFDPKFGKYVFRLPSENNFVHQEDEEESITLDGYHFKLIHLVPLAIKGAPNENTATDAAVYVIHKENEKYYMVKHGTFPEKWISKHKLSFIKQALKFDEIIVTSEAEAIFIAENISLKSLICYQDQLIRSMSHIFDELEERNKEILKENERIDELLDNFWSCRYKMEGRK